MHPLPSGKIVEEIITTGFGAASKFLVKCNKVLLQEFKFT